MIKSWRLHLYCNYDTQIDNAPENIADQDVALVKG